MGEAENEGSRRVGSLDAMSALDLVRTMNREDRRPADAVEAALPHVAAVVDAAVKSISEGGRLVYVGAGSSGRLALQDAAECMPTFGIEPGTVVGLLAGGHEAVAVDKEGVEDDCAAARAEVSALGVGGKDLVVGVSAGGATPYTIAALPEARERGARTACVVNAGDSEMARTVDHPVHLLTGPEVLAGSTRLKAGTAQKMALNMISTATMAGLGHVYDDLMVGVTADNSKLRERAVGIVREITGRGESECTEALELADHDVRVAVLLVDGAGSVGEARGLLERSHGSLRSARRSGDRESGSLM